MCGIIFAANFDKKKDEPANEAVLDIFEDQSNRGTKGFGVVFIQKDGSYKVKRSCNPVKMTIDVYDKDNAAPIILMHHRYPTSSANKMKETHPIEVDNGSLKYKYLVAHNGIIQNDDEMREKHEGLGFVYTTLRKTEYNQEEFNDSECLAIEFSRLAENQISEMEIKGSIAFVALQIDKKTDKVEKVFFGRDDSSPLKMSKTRDKIRISSEGEGDNIKENTFYSFNLTDFKLDKKELKIKKETQTEWETTEPASDHSTAKREDKKEKEETEKIDLTNIVSVLEKIEEYEWDAMMEIEDICEKEMEEINEMVLEAKDKITSSKVEWEDEKTEKITKKMEEMIDKMKLIKEEADEKIKTLKSAAKGGAKTLVVPKKKEQEDIADMFDDDDDYPRGYRVQGYPRDYRIHSQPLEDTKILNQRSRDFSQSEMFHQFHE